MFSLDDRVAALPYAPQNFRDLAQTQTGSEVWDFMRRSDNVIRMETATTLERAAVEPLAAALVVEFGPAFSSNRDRMKQMVGHMARQIMEAIGYEIDRRGLRITRNNLFSSAARYRRKIVLDR